MDSPPFSDGGQPDSYTSSLLPRSGGQSSPMSDFPSELDLAPLPLLPTSPTAQEPLQSLPETDSSLVKLPVHPSSPHEQSCTHTQDQVARYSSQTPNNNYHDQQQQQQQQQHHHHHQYEYSNANSSSSNIDSALMSPTGAIVQQNIQNQAYHKPLSTQPMWRTPGEDYEHNFYESSPPTCGSGISNPNFSPGSVSAVGTWPSPATSYHPSSVERPEKIIWAGNERASSESADGGLGVASDISVTCDGAYQNPFGRDSTDWHCEQLGVLTPHQGPHQGFPIMSAASCPASPTMMPLAVSGYMLRPNMASPTGGFEIDIASSRASEPPMHDYNMPELDHTQTQEHQIPYAQLIYRALMQAPDHSMCLQEIYKWFQDNTEKCKPGARGWMNSIRHNLSMNAGFTKRDRKRAAESGLSETEEAQSNGASGDLKRSTEWTLTDEAIAHGIQSTTRYRNKKSSSGSRDRDAAGRNQSAPNSLHHSSRTHAHGLGRSHLTNRGGIVPHHTRFSGRVERPYRNAPSTVMRMGPTSGQVSGYGGRRSSPLHPYYQQTLVSALNAASPSMKLEPELGAAADLTNNMSVADSFSLMMPEHQAMVNNGPATFNMGSATTASEGSGPHHPQGSPTVYLGPAESHPPLAPSGPFPYSTVDVNLGYPIHSNDDTSADINRPMYHFDGGAGSSNSLYDWNGGNGC